MLKSGYVLCICVVSPFKDISLQYQSGPGCSKLTILLVNILLKFQMLTSEICQYFWLKICVKLLSFLWSLLAVRRHSCYNFCLMYVRVCMHGFVWAITSTFMHGFQNNVAQ